MPTTIKLKNSVTTTSVPSSLVQGEVAINITDKKVWVGNAATTPIQLLGGGADGNFTNISVSSVATFGAGTVSAPSITTSGDTNTGIFFPAADTIAFTEGGTESMRIDSSGNVGIGTSSPAGVVGIGRTLVVYNTGNATLSVQAVDGGNDRNATLELLSSGNGSSTADIVFGDTDTTPGTPSPLRFLGRHSGTTTERMRITSGGTGELIVGGTTATNSNGNRGSIIANGSSSAIFQLNVGNANQSYVYHDSGGMSIWNATNTIMNFATNNTERMRITSDGNLLVGDTGSVVTDGRFRVLQTSTSGNYISRLQSNAASGPAGVSVYYSGSSPNGTGNVFLICEDSTTTRMTVRSNGGIANYSGNNVNLSDAREKTNISLASSYLNKICAIPVKTFNYIDQNLEEDDGLTLGVVAQDVQAVAPELVMESNWAAKDEPEKMRLSIYQTDLQYALMKSIQELKAELDSVKAELQTLKGN